MHPSGFDSQEQRRSGTRPRRRRPGSGRPSDHQHGACGRRCGVVASGADPHRIGARRLARYSQPAPALLAAWSGLLDCGAVFSGARRPRTPSMDRMPLSSLSLALVVVGIAVLGAVASLVLQRLTFGRLSGRIEVAWSAWLRARSFAERPQRGLQAVASRVWEGSLDAAPVARPVALVVHRRLPSRFLDDWTARAALEVVVSPGERRAITEGHALWRVLDGALRRTRTHALLGFHVPASHERLAGVAGFRLSAGEAPPEQIVAAIRRRLAAGSVWITGTSVVVVWTLGTDPAAALEAAVDDALALANWVESMRA